MIEKNVGFSLKEKKCDGGSNIINNKICVYIVHLILVGNIFFEQVNFRFLTNITRAI